MENPVILTDLALLFSLRVRFAALVGLVESAQVVPGREARLSRFVTGLVQEPSRRPL